MESNKRKRNETEENSEQQQKSGHEQTAVGDKRVRSTKPQKAFKYSPNYIECPKCWDEKEEEEEEGSQAKGKKHPSLTIFLAGGISNCPNWQKIAARYMPNLVDCHITFHSIVCSFTFSSHIFSFLLHLIYKPLFSKLVASCPELVVLNPRRTHFAGVDSRDQIT